MALESTSLLRRATLAVIERSGINIEFVCELMRALLSIDPPDSAIFEIFMFSIKWIRQMSGGGGGGGV